MSEPRSVPTAGGGAAGDIVRACVVILLADRPATPAELGEALTGLGLVDGPGSVADAVADLRRVGAIEAFGPAAVRLTSAGGSRLAAALALLDGTVDILQRFLGRYGGERERRRGNPGPAGAAAAGRLEGAGPLG